MEKQVPREVMVVVSVFLKGLKGFPKELNFFLTFLAHCLPNADSNMEVKLQELLMQLHLQQEGLSCQYQVLGAGVIC